ncbi:MAG: hypothetical protein AAF297_11715 [Planctomycetota bacterium]
MRGPRRIPFRDSFFDEDYHLYGLATLTDPAQSQPTTPPSITTTASSGSTTSGPAATTRADETRSINPTRVAERTWTFFDTQGNRAKLDNGLAFIDGVLINTATGQTRVLDLPNGASFADRSAQGLDIRDGLALVGVPSDSTSGPAAGAAYLFDAFSGRLLRAFFPSDHAPGRFFGRDVAFDGAGLVLIAGEESVVTLDFETGDHLATFTFDPPGVGSVEIEAAAGRTLLSLSNRFPVLYDARSGQTIKTIIPTGPPLNFDLSFTIAMSEQHALVGTPFVAENVARQGAIYAYDPLTGERTGYYRSPKPVYDDQIGSAMDIDGHLFLTRSGEDAHVVDARTMTRVTTLPDIGHTSGPVAFSDGQAVLVPTPPGSAVVFNIAKPCGPLDLAPPFGVLDLADLETWLRFARVSDPRADIAAPFGVINLSDTNAVGPMLAGGCP